MSSHDKPFYGKWIISDDEEQRIKKLVAPYQKKPPTEEVRKEIYDLLSDARFRGEISIPFRVILYKDIYKKYPDRIEVLLETKV